MNKRYSLLCRRLLIAQDLHEFYLVFAAYSPDYVAYIQGVLPDTSPAPFLQMHEFGPFHMRNPGAIRELGNIIVAATIHYGS
jgi:hypothetical protein